MRKHQVTLALLFCMAMCATAGPRLVVVRSPKQLTQLTIQTYVAGAVCGLLFLAIAALLSSLIKFEGGANPSDPGKRRMWFWMLLAACFATFFLYNRLMVAPTIALSLQTKFMLTNVLASSAATVSYLILGFLVSKINATGKLGNWFPSKH